MESWRLDKTIVRENRVSRELFYVTDFSIRSPKATSLEE